MPRKKADKETLNEELEIEQELSKDNITPIQDRVTKLFDDIGTDTVVDSDTEVEETNSVIGLDWIDISETLNSHINDPELEDAIMEELHSKAGE